MITDDDRPLSFSPMALDVHRATGDVVGRPAELQAIAQELATARAGRLVGLTVEGEPGIGKTRLLVAAAERATADGFTAIAVTADEELRGPFLVARSILGSPEAARAAERSADRRRARPMPRLDVGAGRSGARHALARQPPAPHVRPGRRRVPGPGRRTAARRPDRRPPVVGRGQPPPAALRGPHRRRQPDLPDVRDPSRGVRGRHRGREPGRRHGPHGRRAPPQARPVLADGYARVPGPGARRSGRPVGRGGDARAGRGRPVHRRGDGVRLPRGRVGPGDRRRLDACRERRAAGALGGEDADLAAGDEAPRRHEGAPGRRGDPGTAVQPAGPARGPARRGRRGARRRGARRDPGAGRHGGSAGRARGGFGRRLQLPARAGPRVRGRDAHVRGAARDPQGDRRRC